MWRFSIETYDNKTRIIYFEGINWEDDRDYANWGFESLVDPGIGRWTIYLVGDNIVDEWIPEIEEKFLGLGGILLEHNNKFVIDLKLELGRGRSVIGILIIHCTLSVEK